MFDLTELEKKFKHLNALEKKLGYSFKNIKNLIHAMTHPSFHKSDFEMLEFIGDRVLNLAIANKLWNKKYKSEKEYAEKLATQVNRFSLLKIANIWELDKYILWSGSDIKSILVDACEAVIGAIFIDGGWEKANDLIHSSWPDETMCFEELDPKSVLQQWGHKTAASYKYKTIEKVGPAHKPQFTIQLTVNQYIVTTTSTSKRTAEKQAALEFLKKYTDLIPDQIK
ncbi:ribonuclease III family protein [Candidatus Nesciobacter abundans]|uniref:Uncharacterized protein n=1 Tax=Candidatus Nesciobacter abundans TaxID=2601668 RepID=A0A5C0UHT0_9PROT|nr:putative dsRNA-binding protein [Candidatus Nesciobacter abundans]QEK39280.1 hypothetical protein FZC36_02505 [Candidatus Nesciobacter abundans]